MCCHLTEVSHDDNFQRPPQTEDSPLVHIIRLELNFSRLPDDATHVTGFPTVLWKVTPCSRVIFTRVSEEHKFPPSRSKSKPRKASA